MNTIVKRFLCFLLILAAIASVSAPVFATSVAAFDILSSSNYAKTFMLSNSGRTTPYTSNSLSKRGTVTYGASSTAYIDNAADEIYIYDVGCTNGKYWAYVSFPVSSRRAYAYIPLSAVTANNGPHTKTSSTGKFYCSLRENTSVHSSYYVSKGETVYLIAKSSSKYQILYPTSNGKWRLAWCSASDYQKYCGSTGTNQGSQNTVKSDAPKDGAFVRIRYAANNRYLDVPAEAASKNGTQLQIWDSATSNANQYFQLVDTGNGWQIISLHSGKVVEVRNSSHSDYAHVAQWTKHSSACARWTIERNNDGTVSFKNKESGLYLNICGGGDAANGVRTIQFHHDNSIAMKFYIETVSLKGYTTSHSKISKSNIKSEKDVSVTSWHPLIGLSATMLQQDDDLEALIENVPVAIDVANFALSWISNSREYTRIHVTQGTDKKMTIEYGTSIEANLSGKQMSLSASIIDQYYNFSPTIIFTSNTEADKCIRSWFGVTGPGKYSMDMKFGKVPLGEPGYYLLIENGMVYQCPIIQQDTSHKVYYTLNGTTSYMFDAADILRNTKVKMSPDESIVVMRQLVKSGYIN